MSPAGKIFVTLAAIGGALGVLAIAGAKTAHAATKTTPKTPTSTQPPDFVLPSTPIVPGSGTQTPAVTTPAAQGPALPAQPQPQTGPIPVAQVLPAVVPTAPTPTGQIPTTQAPAAQPQATGSLSIPNPLGGPPLGTWDATTGNVIGPLGLIVGKFDPKTGIFTTTGGVPIQVPGFGQAPVPVATPTPSAVPAATPVPTPIVLPTATPVNLPVPSIPPISTVLSDTAQMVATLLDAESRPGWNRIEPSVSAWQKARPPLTVDGKLGPKSALLVAQEIGTIPLIRFWPKGSQKNTALNDYRAALIGLANNTTDQIRAQQLRISAQREQAQAFSNAGPLPALSANSLISLAKVA